jgi:hypothetical protein
MSIDTIELYYQKNPLAFVNGIANGAPGQILTFLDIVPENFADFEVLPGAVATSYDVASYCFANQVAAANAVVTQPNTVSLRMICPVREGFQRRQEIFSAFMNALDEHQLSGGVFNVATPMVLYNNCILKSVSDMGGDDKTPQVFWELTFLQYLTTEQAAELALNAMMSKLAAGLPVEDPAEWSGEDANTYGTPTTSSANASQTAAASAGGLANPVNIYGPQ